MSKYIEAYNIVAGKLYMIGNYPKTMQDKGSNDRLTIESIMRYISLDPDDWFLDTNPRLEDTVSFDDIEESDQHPIIDTMKLMLTLNDHWKLRIQCTECKKLASNMDKKILQKILQSFPPPKLLGS